MMADRAANLRKLNEARLQQKHEKSSASHKELGEQIQSMRQQLAYFISAFGEGIPINDADELLSKLSYVRDLSDEVASLKVSLDNLAKAVPDYPKEIKLSGLPEFSEAIKGLQPSKETGAEVEAIATQLKDLGDVLIKKKTEFSQAAKDFVPIRRVVQLNQRTFIFDDTTWGGGSGGVRNLNSDDDSVTAVIETNSYATKITESGSVTYVAKANPGSSQSSAVWQAQKIDETSGTIITWADGNANFDNVATDLTSLTYS